MKILKRQAGVTLSDLLSVIATNLRLQVDDADRQRGGFGQNTLTSPIGQQSCGGQSFV